MVDTPNETGDDGRTTFTDPATLLKLVEDSGRSFAVIEDAIGVLKRSMGRLDLSSPAIPELLKAHLLTVGGPTSVGKFFSFELLVRLAESEAEGVCLEVCRMLAGMELVPGRGYQVEREMIRYLSDRESRKALPLLGQIAMAEAGDVSRTAARAVTKIVGSTAPDALTEAFEGLDLPDHVEARELAESIIAALNRARRDGRTSSEGVSRVLLAIEASEEAAEKRDASSAVSLRPERLRERENRLRAVLREAGRDPSECGNCGSMGTTRVMHIVPLRRSGTERAGNLVALCPPCRRAFEATRRDSSGVRRRLEEISTRQMGLFAGLSE